MGAEAGKTKEGTEYKADWPLGVRVFNRLDLTLGGGGGVLIVFMNV